MAYRNTSALMNAMIAPGLPDNVLSIVTKTNDIDAIESIIIGVHNMNFFAVGKKSRKPVVVRARNQACYLLYIYTKLSLEEIMLLMYPALTNHTSVLYAVNNIDRSLRATKIFKNQFLLHGLQQCLDAVQPMPVVKVKHDGVWRLKSEII